MSLEDFSENGIDERAIRRLAASKGTEISRTDGLWNCCGVQLDDDDIWACLNAS